MEKIPILHKGAFIFSFVCGIAAVVMMAAGLLINSNLRQAAGYALIFVGIFALLTAVTVFAVYLNQERIYRKTMADPLLNYQLSNEELTEMKNRNIQEIKAQNLISLIIMLFFFLVVIIIGLFLGRDGRITSLIMLVIAIIISLLALLITKIRVEKIRNSNNLVIVSKKGAILHGQFHNWSSMGAQIDEVSLELPDSLKATQGRLQITYSALTRTGRNKLTLNFIFSTELEQAVYETCRQLGWPQDYQ